MSRIFRSDSPVAGDRVVVRRIRGDHTSDIIGFVDSVTPAAITLTPQKIGGFPSDGAPVTIARTDIKIMKKLSPRTVRNSDIRALEVAYAKAFPGIDHRWVGGWYLRAGDGITERSNSAAPLGSSVLFEEFPLAEIRRFYAEHHLPAQVLLPERIGTRAEKYVTELGPEILVMVRDLGNLPRADFPARFRVDEEPDEAWLSLYHFRGHSLPATALEQLRTRIDGRLGFGRLLAPDGSTMAITRGTITDGRLGFSAVEVAPQWRRQGAGTALGIHMLHWGLQCGAESAYLQVIASNTAGIGLYEKIGFIEHHRHRYGRIGP